MEESSGSFISDPSSIHLQERVSHHHLGSGPRTLEQKKTFLLFIWLSTVTLLLQCSVPSIFDIAFSRGLQFLQSLVGHYQDRGSRCWGLRNSGNTREFDKSQRRAPPGINFFFTAILFSKEWAILKLVNSRWLTGAARDASTRCDLHQVQGKLPRRNFYGACLTNTQIVQETACLFPNRIWLGRTSAWVFVARREQLL